MTAPQAWNTMVNRLAERRIELPTVPKTKREPVWFSATTDGELIFINEAKENKPSCKLSMPRKLTFSIFEKVYPLYFRRENGEKVSLELSAVTVDQVYYLSLIKHLIT